MLVSLTKENIMSRMKEQWQDEQERLEQDMQGLMEFYYNSEQQTIDFIDKAEYDAWCEYHKLGNNWHHEYVNK